MSESTEQQKTAGAIVYLVEELGDARMRCDQLLRYVDKASKLIEKSSHKDHFFEVAGDVIRGIPETAFKLHKALEAVALAANRIDYEEIKQDLRPEKVEELERVLKDVRVRQVQRRSLPMVNPASVVEQLKSLAKKAREGGSLDTEALGTLIASLEVGAPKIADDAGAKVAGQLEAMAHALENPPEGEQPSRIRLAQVLRKTYAEHVDVVRMAADGDKFKKEATGLKPARVFASMQETVKQILKSRVQLRETEELLHDVLGDASGLTFTDNYNSPKIRAVRDELRELDNTIGTVYRNVERLEKDMQPMIVPAGARHASSDEEKKSRYEEGKPADPTENMSKEDAKAWKDNTDEHGDKFKKEAGKPPEPVTSQINAAIEQLKKLSRGSGNPKLLLIGAFTSLSDALTKMGQDEVFENLIDRITSAMRSKWSQKDWMEAEKAEKDKTANSEEKKSRYEEGKPADPTENMSEEDAKEWKENTDEHKDKFKSAARGDEALSWKAA